MGRRPSFLSSFEPPPWSKRSSAGPLPELPSGRRGRLRARRGINRDPLRWLKRAVWSLRYRSHRAMYIEVVSEYWI